MAFITNNEVIISLNNRETILIKSLGALKGTYISLKLMVLAN
jgi:hypothetical protein